MIRVSFIPIIMATYAEALYGSPILSVSGFDLWSTS